MNYSETIDYLYSRLPMFTKIGSAALKKDITNTIEFCQKLDNPQNKFKSIHIGGTNGKGSTSHMLAAILQTAGYKTGLYTSPHLRDFRERIRINGEMIREDEVVQFVQSQQKNIEQIEPSFFEATVAMAFDHFARHKVDIAIIEVGLGGRLDSTNVITPLLSVITNISLDHTNILGNTLTEIASEKAGIIKPKVPVVIGQRQAEVEDVFITKAKENHSKIIFASDEWEIESSESSPVKGGKEALLPLQVKPKTNLSTGLTPDQGSNSLAIDLTGSYQLKNLCTVLSSVKELQKQSFKITWDHLRTALKQVKHLTGLMGRWQILSEKPLIVCDTGHNEDGVRQVVKTIESTPYQTLHIVLGMVKDKDIKSVLQLLPKNAIYYFCSPAVERGKPAGELAQEGRSLGLQGEIYASVQEAFTTAKEKAGPDDLIFVGGSTFVVAEII